jgi:hypothetical protein
MSTPKKSTRSVGVKPEAIESFIPLFTKTVGRFAEVQKKSLEIVAEQNAEFTEACKKSFDFAPEPSGLFFFDLFGQALERAIETQKAAISEAVEQTNAVAEIAREKSGYFAKTAEGVTGLFQQAVEQSVAAQKKALEYLGEQNKSVYESAKKQFRISNPVAEAFQTGVDALIETQKTVLDIAAKPRQRSAA